MKVWQYHVQQFIVKQLYWLPMVLFILIYVPIWLTLGVIDISEKVDVLMGGMMALVGFFITIAIFIFSVDKFKDSKQFGWHKLIFLKTTILGIIAGIIGIIVYLFFCYEPIILLSFLIMLVQMLIMLYYVYYTVKFSIKFSKE